jgi:uncharacterized protein YecE (DUF72 family)
MSGTCHIGTCGWSYGHWRRRFYPKGVRQGDWLAYYARHFATVEINATFYRLAKESTFERWRDLAPPGFVFAVKASRFITHVRGLRDCAEPLGLLLGRARILGAHLGPLLYQLPPGWRPDPDVLAAFADLLPADLVHVFEFRDAACYTAGLKDILAVRGLVFCIHDMPGAESPHWITGPAVYLRLHGGAAGHLGRYGEAGLAPWARLIGGQLAGGCDVYAYFNNDAEAHAVEDAAMLRDLLGGASPGDCPLRGGGAS